MTQTDDWQKAKRKCKLDKVEIEMAKRLSLTPAKVLRMIPDEKEVWKDIPPLRIRRLYDKRFGSPLKRADEEK